jgi:hypothetical protein
VTPASPKVIQAGVLDIFSPAVEAGAYKLAGGEDGWGKLVATIALQSVAGVGVTALLIATGPGLVTGLVVGAVLGGLANTAINWGVAAYTGDAYSGAQAAFDFGLGAVGGALPGLMVGSAVRTTLQTTGTRVLSAQMSMQLEWGSAGWGVAWGGAQGALNARVSP